MTAKLWVKFRTNRATQVSTEQCQDVDDFLEACKKELSPLLDSYASSQLSLSTTEGGPLLQSDDAIPAQNTAQTPLFISVADGSAQPTTVNIVTKAFPPLGRRQLYSSAKSTTRQQSIYGITMQVESGTFGILQELKLEHLKKRSSVLWLESARSARNTLADWSGEVDIQSYVINGLLESESLAL